MALSVAASSTRKGASRAKGVRVPTASAAGNDYQGNLARGALSGTMGASPFAILATTPELPLSTGGTGMAASQASKSPARHTHAGLSLRRNNSSNSNSMGRSVSGGVTLPPPVTASRGVGLLLKRFGAAVIMVQLLLVCVLVTRPAWFRDLTAHAVHSAQVHHLPGQRGRLDIIDHGRAQLETESGAKTLSIIAKLAADSRSEGLTVIHPTRRERMWTDADTVKAAQQQKPLGKAETPTKPSTIIVHHTLSGTNTGKNAATETTVAKANIESNKAAAGGTAAGQAQAVVTKPVVANSLATGQAVTAVKATTDAGKVDTMAAATAGKAVVANQAGVWPPFLKPVVPFAGRAANPPPIIGVVFYGRRDRVRILDCYLQRNMARNGGLLTSVVFVIATWQPQDVAFLDRLIALRGAEYKKLYPQRVDKGYTGHYKWMDPSSMYVKIDDDVVYIADEAIDRMLLAHNLNKYHLISANVINHQPLESPHSQKGAHFQYEQTKPGDKTSWRPVMRPVAAANNAGGAAAAQNMGAMQPVQYIDNGWDVWGDWRRAANVHYSFLANHAANRLNVYDFPNGEQLWDFNKHVGYIRWRINMIMFKGATIDVNVYNMSSTVGTYPGDDEDFITRILPQKLNRTSAAVSGALAVHFSFYMQRGGLENNTDLLDRYTLLAERTCGQLVPI